MEWLTADGSPPIDFYHLIAGGILTFTIAGYLDVCRTLPDEKDSAIYRASLHAYTALVIWFGVMVVLLPLLLLSHLGEYLLGDYVSTNALFVVLLLSTLVSFHVWARQDDDF